MRVHDFLIPELGRAAPYGVYDIADNAAWVSLGVDHDTASQLIAATTTDTGLKVRCEIDSNTYPAGVKVTDAEMDAINIHRHEFHGDWNYTISPQSPVRSDSS